MRPEESCAHVLIVIGILLAGVHVTHVLIVSVLCSAVFRYHSYCYAIFIHQSSRSHQPTHHPATNQPPTRGGPVYS